LVKKGGGWGEKWGGDESKFWEKKEEKGFGKGAD